MSLQVLQLVMRTGRSVAALAVCATASTHYHQLATTLVRTNTVSLMEQCSDSRLLATPGLAPLRWLVETAGWQVINSPDVARALMRLTRWLPADEMGRYGLTLRTAGEQQGPGVLWAGLHAVDPRLVTPCGIVAISRVGLLLLQRHSMKSTRFSVVPHPARTDFAGLLQSLLARVCSSVSSVGVTPKQTAVCHVDGCHAMLVPSAAGFQDTSLTDDLLVCLAKHCPTSIGRVFPPEGFPCWGRSLSPLYKAFSALGTACPVGHAAALQMKQELLPAVTADNLPDLLHLVCNRPVYKPSSSSTYDESRSPLAILWKHEKEHVRLLHSSDGGSGNAPGLQDSQQEQQDHACMVVRELLATCLLRDNSAMAQLLCGSPAAATLGEPPVLPHQGSC